MSDSTKFRKRPKRQIQVDVNDWRDYILDDKDGEALYEGDLVTYKQASGGIIQSDGKESLCVLEWNEFRLSWQVRDLSVTKYESCYTLSSCHLTKYVKPMPKIN